MSLENLDEIVSQEKVEILPEHDPNYRGPLGAVGYGLDERQQRAAAALIQWQKDSMKAEIVLGGPIEDFYAT